MKKLILVFLISVVSLFGQSSIDVGTNASIDLGTGANLDVDSHSGTFTGDGTINNSPLPVELTDFTATIIDNSVKLAWETVTEVNNFGFEVERQYQVSSVEYQDSSEWEKIGFVQGNGTTNSPKQYSFADPLNLSLNPNLDRIDYRLKQIDNDGTFAYSKIVTVDLSTITSVDNDIDYTFSLEQNYPNPFNPVTSIEYQVARHEKVLLKVYDVLGNEVTTLVNETKAPGIHKVEFDASNLSSGIYFYKLQTDNGFSAIKKLILLK